jgi:hypothetical protein
LELRKLVRNFYKNARLKALRLFFKRRVFFFGSDGRHHRGRVAVISGVQARYIRYKEAGGELKQNNKELGAVLVSQVLVSLGYSVYVVDQDEDGLQIKSWLQPELILGKGLNYKKLVELFPNTPKRIYFATGSHCCFQDAMQRSRHMRIAEKWGCSIENNRPSRQQEPGLELSTALIVKGNEQVAATYASWQGPVFCIDNFSTCVDDRASALQRLEGIDYGNSRTGFLWMGSKGFVHKGLDLVLEVFSEHPELTLYVAGPTESKDEAGFLEVYGDLLRKSPNIYDLGWLEVGSGGFKSLAERCAFLIYPSCAEGSPGAVINCMSLGLIPIVTKESGLSIAPEIGFVLAEGTTKAISDAVVMSSSLDEDKVQKMAKNVVNYSYQNYHVDDWPNKLREIFTSIEALEAKVRGK